METSEFESTAVSNSIRDPESGFGSAPSFPSPDRNPETSDLNCQAVADALHRDLQYKLGLKDKDEGGETEKKDSEFDDGEEVCNKAGAGESGEGDGWGGDNGNWSRNEDNNWNEIDKVGRDFDVTVDEVKEEGRNSGRTHQYPVRPEAEDCRFYLKTGTCKFGFNCKFNHPVRRKNQAVKEKAGEREESADRPGQAECKYYLSSGGCKFGEACKYNHTRGNFSAAPFLELNFLGLPIRLGAKECPYYMRTGSCMCGANCKFDHPDPTAVEECDPPSGYGNGGSISLQGVSQPSVPSLSSPRTLNETAPFMPMMLSPTQGVSPQSSEWSGYQGKMFAFDRNSSITFNTTTSKYIVKFAGKSIETTVTDKAVRADEWVHDIYSKYAGKATVVGLDVEWRPHPIRSMSNKSATLQLCIEDKCLILQLFYMDSFPISLKSFFMDSSFTFVGIEVAGDIAKLRNEYGFQFSKQSDIRELAKIRWPGRFRRPGLKDLASEVVGLHMRKPMHVCKSDWEARILSEEQVEYGCIDAYASYCVGHKLVIEG